MSDKVPDQASTSRSAVELKQVRLLKEWYDSLTPEEVASLLADLPPVEDGPSETVITVRSPRP